MIRLLSIMCCECVAEQETSRHYNDAHNDVNVNIACSYTVAKKTGSGNMAETPYFLFDLKYITQSISCR